MLSGLPDADEEAHGGRVLQRLHQAQLQRPLHSGVLAALHPRLLRQARPVPVWGWILWPQLQHKWVNWCLEWVNWCLGVMLACFFLATSVGKSLFLGWSEIMLGLTNFIVQLLMHWNSMSTKKSLINFLYFLEKNLFIIGLISWNVSRVKIWRYESLSHDFDSPEKQMNTLEFHPMFVY